MKKNWKQFWTLNRHHAEGFTLVELIVVIAILAILSAVAIPAYSGYINKTHMTTDQKLVSEVADALTLFYYANPNAGSAYVVLAPDGTVARANENGAKAMEAVFGAGWANTTLSYSKWADTDSGMLGAASGAGAADVLNSSFLQGSTRTELLQNVSNLTTAASGFVGQISNPSLVYSGMVGNFASSEAEFDALCQQYGIETVGEGSNKQFADSVTDTQISNLMVAAAAQSFTNAANGGESNTAAELVLMYATYTAAVNSPTASQADKDRYNAMNQAFTTATSVSDVQAALDAFNAGSSDLMNTYTSSSQSGTDSAAIMALMSAINDASGNLTADDIKDANLFTTGKGANAFNTYVSAAEAMAELGSVDPSHIALFLEIQEGNPKIFCSNDAAYLQGK